MDKYDQGAIVKRVKELTADGSRVTIGPDDPAIGDLYGPLVTAKARKFLSTNHRIVVEVNPAERTVVVFRADLQENTIPEFPKGVSVRNVKKGEHTWHEPRCYRDFTDILLAEKSHIVYLGGPTGCGKSVLVKQVASKLGRKVYRINCHPNMESSVIFGDRTVAVDEKTGQNFIKYVPGVVEQAMVEGLDKEGNEIGEPAILYFDEAATMPAHISIALNRLFEDIAGNRRELVLAEDGGRMVRSHGGMRIVLAGNTFCRGFASDQDALFTAQGDAQDISFLNRVTAAFRMGYDRKVEQTILFEKIGDDRIVSDLLKFRDAIRGNIKSGNLLTPFSTRHLIHIADLYQTFGDVTKAIWYSVFQWLPNEEQAIYNEAGLRVFGRNMLQEFNEDDVDMM